MRGRNTLWILGTDHAGIATQAVVEKMLREEGIAREELGREAFVERVWAWKEEYGSRIVEQYKRLGASSTTSASASPSTRATCAPSTASSSSSSTRATSTATTTWSTGTRARIRRSPTSRSRTARSRTRSTRSTTRSRAPTACSRSPPCARRRCSPTPPSPSIPDDERYADLVGEHCVLPLVGRRLPIIADEHVDVEFGTGALKITPGHDPNDFEIGRRHGLEEIGVIGPDGRMTEEAGERFAGLDRRRGPGGGRRRSARGGSAARRGALRPLGPLLAPLRRADRAADLAAVVLPHGRAGQAGDRGRRTRRGADRPGAVEARLPRLDAGDPPLVRLAPALVGAPDPGLVLRRLRGDLRRRARPRSAAAPAAASCARRRTSSTPGSARRSGPSRRSAGPTTRPSCAPSTRPAS